MKLHLQTRESGDSVVICCGSHCIALSAHFRGQQSKSSLLLYPALSAYRKCIAFWKVPRLCPFVLLVRATCTWRRLWNRHGRTEILEEKTAVVPFCCTIQNSKVYISLDYISTIEFVPRSKQTYLFIPRCRVLLEKLIGLQLVKKFPAFHGTRRFIAALISVRHLSLSWASPIHSIYPHPTSWRSILILSTHLRLCLPSGLLPSGFPTKTLYTPSPHPYAPHAQPISFFSILSPAQYWVRHSTHNVPKYIQESWILCWVTSLACVWVCVCDRGTKWQCIQNKYQYVNRVT